MDSDHPHIFYFYNELEVLIMTERIIQEENLPHLHLIGKKEKKKLGKDEIVTGSSKLHEADHFSML